MGTFLADNKTKIFSLLVAIATAIITRYQSKIEKPAPTCDCATEKFMDALKELQGVAEHHETTAVTKEEEIKALQEAVATSLAEAARAKTIAERIAAIVS